MDREAVTAVADSVRLLTVDSIEKARSGHPGLPLGCAEFGALLFGEIMNHDPEDPAWINRDRFVLSAGHGSMLLYSLLHLSGYDLQLRDIQEFRQLGSRTPGHPEIGRTPGVECTTGPLGQGIANAVGMAIAARHLAARFNSETTKIIDHYVFVLASDGDLMEGVCYEAASLAGHLALDRLVLFYDSNGISIDGSTAMTFTEDVSARFRAMNWQVQSVCAYDLEGILQAVDNAKAAEGQPSLIVLRSIIGRGAPNLAGKHQAHSSPLGETETRALKESLGVPSEARFRVYPQAYAYFREKRNHWRRNHEEWRAMFDAWRKAHPTAFEEWSQFFSRPDLQQIPLPTFEPGVRLSTRRASGTVLNAAADHLPNLIGGSADLGAATETVLRACADFQKDHPTGRNIRFGVREHAMAAICNGMALYGGIRPFCATLLVFADYMRPAMRLASLMGLPVIYVLTHDSVLVGEDGPTHQPIEQIASLRIIPGLLVLRPADAEETRCAWQMALENASGPTTIILSRQDIAVFRKHDPEWELNIRRGAYVAADSQDMPALTIVATGSEVALAIEARERLSQSRIRVVSMVSRELFQRQPEDYRRRLIPENSTLLIVEAGTPAGWELFRDRSTAVIAVERFGLSGPGERVAAALGISEEAVIKESERLLQDRLSVSVQGS